MRATVIAIAILLSVGGLGLCSKSCATGCGRGYSDGARTGTIVKFSRKGLAIKSWEGEMVLGGMKMSSGERPQLVANVWEFTVKDDGPVAAVQKAFESGKPVKVNYVEWVLSGCTMESGYEVVSVE